MSVVTRLNLVVIRSFHMDRAEAFYQALGLTFVRHRHGNGPEHLACESDTLVFEIYPAKDTADATTHLRLGFAVASLTETLAAVTSPEIGAVLVSKPASSPWGLRAVIADPDNNRVELTEDH